MLRLSSFLSIFLLFLNLHALVFASSSSDEPRCHPDESSALLKLDTDWNKSSDCCTWSGVDCEVTTGRVVRLGIYNFGDELLTISGPDFKTLVQNLTYLARLEFYGIDMSSVPLELLSNLSSSLTHLGLSSCLLNGELPDKVFHSVPKLEFLDLSENNISGQVPHSLLNLDHLNYLNLRNNSFSGKLPELCSNSTPTPIRNFSLNCVVGSPLSNLTTLMLARNFIHGPIPSWIYELPYLETLDLGNNHFSGEIGNFQTTSLSGLLLGYNRLQGVIPRSIFLQQKLGSLDLSSNNLTGIIEIEEVVLLHELSYLLFSFNNLTLSFNNSKDLALQKIGYLGLASCNIVEFPRFLKYEGIQFLDLSRNRIKGNVPKWLWEVGKNSLINLNLSHNSFTYIDPLPWRNLRFLDLQSNLFSVPLPILSPALVVFSMSKNYFSGEIPTSICNLTSLQVLDLSYNNLSRKFPQCLGNLSEFLSVLDLRHNKLHGTISPTFIRGNVLRSLNLNGNRLEGLIPRSLVNCSNLEILDLGNNVLYDKFPNWLQSLPELQVLILRGNKFHGSLGNPELGFPFVKLRIMDLSYNEFTGPLPSKYLESFKAMKMNAEKVKLDYMGEFYYQDSVVVTMKGYDFELEKIQTIFTTIDFSSNYFSGGIPKILGELVSLKGLNLSHNMLTGNLPSSLGNLSNLEWLDLSCNKFGGKIPLGLANIPWLAMLNFSHNHLEGPIPRGDQFNTFSNESFAGNLNLCGFPLSKLCDNRRITPLPPTPDQEGPSSITSGFSWKIVMMGFASGVVIGVSIGYILLYSNGKLCWISERIVEEFQYTRARRPKTINARRPRRP